MLCVKSLGLSHFLVASLHLWQTSLIRTVVFILILIPFAFYFYTDSSFNIFQCSCELVLCFHHCYLDTGLLSHWGHRYVYPPTWALVPLQCTHMSTLSTVTATSHMKLLSIWFWRLDTKKNEGRTSINFYINYSLTF